MRQQIRLFALGLLTAALLIFAFYVMIDETDAQIDQIPADTLITQIEADGYRVITEEEFIDYSFYIEEKKNEEDKNGEKDNKKDKQDEASDEEPREEDEEVEDDMEDEEEVKTISFTVSQGDVSHDIAFELEDNDIIEDASEFVQYLEDNDYSPYIQLGTFEVTSEMSLKEIAEAITTFPGN